MIKKRWKLKVSDEKAAEALQSELKIHPVLCRLLVQRGITTFDASKQFFRSNKDHLHDPFLMKGMELAVNRIHRAIEANEKILIFGDYDVDGTTAVAVVFTYFQRLHPNILFYVPNRFTEGYGVSKKGIDYAHEQGVGLIITLDCGIKSMLLVDEANRMGMEVIICDHHLPDVELPKALAILNPKQVDCPYPYKELCGCGIGYKLISAYAERFDINREWVDSQLDLVATAIAADIVPITGENRTLCVLGLNKANEDPSIPISALKQISDMKKPFTISDLVFIIAPRVNAAGRMDDARKAVQLFIEPNEDQAKELAKVLQLDNNERRDVDRQTSQEALEQIEHNPLMLNRRSTVVYQSHWHKGVVGIVASRLIDHYYRPTIVLTQSNGKITGSARSIKGFNLYDGLSRCADLLETYGGHYFAAGLTLAEEQLPEFIERFETVVCDMVADDLFVPELEIDADLPLHHIQAPFMKLLDQFAPHGPDNMKPVFRTKGVYDFKGYSSVVKERHLRLSITADGHSNITGIGFNLAHKLDIVKSGLPFDVVYHLEENEWNDKKTIQLKIIDVEAGNGPNFDV